MVTSRPSRIQVTPSAATIIQCQRDQGSRSMRWGTLVLTVARSVSPMSVYTAAAIAHLPPVFSAPFPGKVVSMHPGEELPVKPLGRNRVKRNGFDHCRLAVGQHATDDGFGLTDQTTHRFIAQVLRDGLVLRRRQSSSQGMAQDSGFGRERHSVVTRARLKLLPLPDCTRHILDQSMDTAAAVMAMRGPLCHHEQVTLVRHAQGLFESPQNNLVDICIRVWILIDQHALGSGLIGTSQREMP